MKLWLVLSIAITIWFIGMSAFTYDAIKQQIANRDKKITAAGAYALIAVCGLISLFFCLFTYGLIWAL